jgi:hypothetical protein
MHLRFKAYGNDKSSFGIERAGKIVIKSLKPGSIPYFHMDKVLELNKPCGYCFTLPRHLEMLCPVKGYKDDWFRDVDEIRFYNDLVYDDIRSNYAQKINADILNEIPPISIAGVKRKAFDTPEGISTVGINKKVSTDGIVGTPKLNSKDLTTLSEDKESWKDVLRCMKKLTRKMDDLDAKMDKIAKDVSELLLWRENVPLINLLTPDDTKGPDREEIKSPIPENSDYDLSMNASPMDGF